MSRRTRPRILYVTDRGYQARGRDYGAEDTALSARLAADFEITLCHPREAASLMAGFKAVVVRNSGPVIHYQEAYDAFRDEALARGVRVYNPVTGRGDMRGKGYLLELTRAGYPVIPTVDRPEDLGRLPAAASYVVKPRVGADSVGLRYAGPEEVEDLDWAGLLVQPRIDFRYEVSFYFVDDDVQYALHAPPDRRWALERYEPTSADLDFARRFIAWNTLDCGIQRVDACRTPEGGLLLVELEDLNPYLSLDLVPDGTRDAFVAAMTTSLHRLVDA